MALPASVPQWADPCESGWKVSGCLLPESLGTWRLARAGSASGLVVGSSLQAADCLCHNTVTKSSTIILVTY